MLSIRSVSVGRIAIAAIVALLSFASLVVTANLVQHGQYNAASEAVSNLALGRAGWLMTAAFVCLGAGTLLVAAIVRRCADRAVIGPALLTITGLLSFVSAVFQTDPDGAPATVHGEIHMAAGLTNFLLVVAAMVACGVAFRRRASWRGYALVSLLWAAVAVGEIVLTFLLPQGLFGVAQRVFLTTCVAWLVLTAVLAIRVSNGRTVQAGQFATSEESVAV